jgi:hypothetical protein
MSALFDRPVLELVYRSHAMHVALSERVDRLERYSLGARFIEPKPNIGPRGGEGNRAKTKAARKANLRRRKGR